MHVVPLTVGVAARAWDEQHHDVTAAAGQIGRAPTGGFTEGVSAAASRFATTWQRHATRLADQAAARADGLRTSTTGLLQTDAAVGLEVAALHGFLVQGR